MQKGGRSKQVALAALAAGALIVGGGCSKLRSSLNKSETVTLSDLQAQVATLQQQVADLQAAVGQTTPVEPVDAPLQAGRSRTGDLTDQNRQTSTASVSGAGNRLAKGARAMVTANILNVRESARAESTKVGALKKGTMVNVIAVEGDWAKITFNDPRTPVSGWVKAEFLQQEE